MILAGDIALGLAAAFASVFVVLYGLTAKFWQHEVGLHLMYFTGVLALALDYLLYALTQRSALPSEPLPRLLIYGAIAVALGWRLSILVRSQILRRRSD